MTILIKETVKEISRLSEDQQNILAIYIKKHLKELLAEAQREKYIEEGNYNIDDFNEETKQAIINIEEEENLTICKNKNDLYNQLGI
ncbi:hypothetical protein [Geminocystis sp. GBBB08]|uniref:hypothetical protein n=1 Tax=Geminocystis sp. GBBB08 TaxID=2604140 RepID=UPI0027E217F0|nr:hypothetical protein [Geminocystis sp. GBBB08]MBL1209133.1 hypothetical protein [Geminocystis sp. GBBB08]